MGTSWIAKLWLYGGWFYLSLLPALALIWLSKKKPQILTSFILLVTLFWGIYWLAFFSRDWFSWWQKFNRPLNEKKVEFTFSQEPFAQELSKVLSGVGKICLFSSWDIPTNFLIQRLYPIKVKVVGGEKETQGCEFLISQFTPLQLPGYQLEFEKESNYLYRKP